MYRYASKSRFRTLALAFSIVGSSTIFTAAGDSQVMLATPVMTYADLADLSLPAPVAAHVRITRAVRLKGDDAATVPAGRTRFYIEADMLSLIKGPGGMPTKVSYLADLPNNAKGKPPKLEKKSEHLIFASTVAGRPGELRLAAPDGQLRWDPAQADIVRRVLAEASQRDAAPRISGIGRGFHVPGSLPGESETQIFLQAADGRPISLNVLRRPGELPHWSTALSEIVDDAAEPPRRDTLLWYRLACTLPRSLPAHSLADAGPEQARAIRMDYQIVLQGLGPCSRNRRS